MSIKRMFQTFVREAGRAPAREPDMDPTPTPSSRSASPTGAPAAEHPAAGGTKARILDTAEQLFAEHGYEGTSLRVLTARAGVNLAAVHYHFGSKQGLFRAVFARRIAPINAERLARLAVLEARGSERPPSSEELLEAFLAPAVRLMSEGESGQRFLQLVGRMRSATGESAEGMREIFREVEARYAPAFLGAAPHLSMKDLFWRVFFVIGAMCHTLADPQRMRVTTGGLCDATDHDEYLRQLVAFAAAGLRAPSASPHSGPEAGPGDRSNPPERAERR